MLYIVLKERTVFNIDNEESLNIILKSGGVLLTEEEIVKYGMKGYEAIISPNNTVVNPDGTIVFTKPVTDLTKLKEQKLKQIDQETSNAILSGFDYTIDDIKYHFSYDSFDQQNFADTANMCQLALSGTEGLPTSVTWNSYLEDGTLVQQVFDANQFLELYVKGAMVHKVTQMSIGGKRKAALQLANTKEEIEAI